MCGAHEGSVHEVHRIHEEGRESLRWFLLGRELVPGERVGWANEVRSTHLVLGYIQADG